MAGTPAGIKVDENGIIQNGRFVGQPLTTVMQYLEHLETAANDDPAAGAPPAGNPPPAGNAPPKDPAAELAARGGGRVDAIANLTLATAKRLEADDEAAAAAELSDYGKFKKGIDEMKKTATQEVRSARGFHRQAYFFLKSQDPEHQALLLGGAPAPVADPPDTDDPPPADPPAADPPVPVQPPAAAPKPPVTPKAVPPPAARGNSAPPAAPKAPKLTLKGNHKTERIAAASGMSHEKYLERLQSQGLDQAYIDSMAAKREVGDGAGQRRRSVYDA